MIEATKDKNRKFIESKLETPIVPIENIPTECSDRIQELINKTKEQLKG